jgi:hypothetical protein
VHTQAEVDGVIQRWLADHHERAGGGEDMTNGPVFGPGPEESDDETAE